MPMKRIRTIKPEFFTSEDVTSMPIPVRLTFIGLWLYVDDYGNENAKASLIKAAVWPEDDEITLDVVEEHLLFLAEAGQVRFYTVGKRSYLSIVNWSKHQRVDKPSKTNVPAPPEEPLATRGPETLAEEGKGESAGGVGGQGGALEGAAEGESEGAGEGTSRASTRPPFSASLPPSPFCPAHPTGTIAPCRACGNARLAKKAWEDQLAAAFDQSAGHTVEFEPLPDVDEFEEAS